MRIQELVVTPIAFADPPLLNADGLHQPHVLRAVLELVVEDDRGGTVTGLGECTGHSFQLDWLRLVAEHLPGRSVFDATAVRHLVDALLRGAVPDVDTSPDATWRHWADRTDPPESHGAAPIPASLFDRRRIFSAIEVALLDAQGKLLGVPVVDLLGGRVRESVPYSAYLFYKWAGHPRAGSDEFGEALDPAGIVRQARMLVDRHGFGSLKLKGGVMPPAEEIAAIRALAAEFPGVPLRIDPNTAWTLETSIEAARELDGTLEYFEDPVKGLVDMARLAAVTEIPLATNMCVVTLDDIAPAIRMRSVDIVLADHHYWGGLRATTALGDVCAAAGFGLSMHSNSHLGISLAAMTHAAAATDRLAYACDTHYPWNAVGDVIAEGPMVFVDGSLSVPEGPGLGVTLDPVRLQTAHELYLSLGREHRRDAEYLHEATGRPAEPLPRW